MWGKGDNRVGVVSTHGLEGEQRSPEKASPSSGVRRSESQIQSPLISALRLSELQMPSRQYGDIEITVPMPHGWLKIKLYI